MKQKDLFKSFAKKGTSKNIINLDGKGVIYTRVSTKEQAENNASLSTQKKHCLEFAKKKGIDILAYFGGTYESAKSDERKEFQKMLSFVKRSKEVSYIIVYSYDRFSRTGANGAYISDQLRKQGIVTLSATQQVDTQTAAGSFQQNLYYMFSQFDNELRRDKSVAGMREKIENGYWIGTVPYGYVNLNPGKGKVQNIVPNEKGKLLKLAFKWKATENITHREICERLEKKGLSLNPKRLSDYFRNPFYCGLVTSGHIPGKMFEGKHEAIVSKSMFLKVNNILSEKRSSYTYNRDDINLPLKIFVKSASTNTPITGYLVKKKGLYYYKNNYPNSKENVSAKKLNGLFSDLLSTYQLKEKKYHAPIKEMMMYAFKEQQKDQLIEAENQLKKLNEATQKLDRLEERFVFEEITAAQYEKFKAKLEKEIEGIEEKSQNKAFNLSNHEKAIELALNYTCNLQNIWLLGDIEAKRAIQNLVFPEGITYDFKNQTYRTPRVNSYFSAIASISNDLKSKKQRASSNKSNLPCSVPGVGLEPTRPNGHKILSLACLPIPPSGHHPDSIARILTIDSCESCGLAEQLRESNPFYFNLKLPTRNC